MEFRCPRCQGGLAPDGGSGRRCEACGARYPSRFGFLDFRLAGSGELSLDDDARLAEELAAHEGREDFSTLQERLERLRPAATPSLATRHRAHFAAEAARARAALDRLGAGPFLDIGCGLGRYTAEAAARGWQAAGIDAALSQLILTRRLLAGLGLTAHLAAANAEALPFGAGAFASAAAADVLEHVAEPRGMVRELNRILRPGGRAVLATPNRYSLTPEPHVGIWGLGWLPRPVAIRAVRRWRGVDYAPIRPLSARALRRLIRAEFDGEYRISAPGPGVEEIVAFGAFKRALARGYGLVERQAPFAVLPFAPYFVADLLRAADNGRQSPGSRPGQAGLLLPQRR